MMNTRKLPKRDTGKDERKHLTGREVEKLLAAVKGARHEARDQCLILLMFRHGLRVSEAVGLKILDVVICRYSRSPRATVSLCG
jgi:integrase